MKKKNLKCWENKVWIFRVKSVNWGYMNKQKRAACVSKRGMLESSVKSSFSTGFTNKEILFGYINAIHRSLREWKPIAAYMRSLFFESCSPRFEASVQWVSLVALLSWNRSSVREEEYTGDSGDLWIPGVYSIKRAREQNDLKKRTSEWRWTRCCSLKTIRSQRTNHSSTKQDSCDLRLQWMYTCHQGSKAIVTANRLLS